MSHEQFHRGRWRAAAIVAICLVPSMAHAQGGDGRRAQVAAATDNAVTVLRREIGQLHIRRNLTVDSFTQTTEAEAELLKTLRRAQLIGGPRWIDEQTCQVRLEISGARVADALVQIAASRPRVAPLPAEAMAVELLGWRDRSFAATGSSAASAVIEQALPPGDGQAWSRVEDHDRREALASARHDAVRRALDSVAPLPLTEDHTVAHALAAPNVNRRMTRYLSDRPVTRVDFREELEVEVELAGNASEAFNVFREAVENERRLARPADERQWAQLRGQWEQQMAQPIGSARVVRVSAPDEAASLLPRAPPQWVGDQIEVKGTAEVGKSKLKAARAAEDDARARLRARLDALHLTPGLTLGEAARRDGQLDAALNRALLKARTVQAEYHGEQTVAVRLALDLRDVWEELGSGR